jgi:divalent metal cation (Fe/Co/Zn/Cd) transporter
MSSIAAAVGTAGTIAGHSLIDPLAALVVGGMVMKLGLETGHVHV